MLSPVNRVTLNFSYQLVEFSAGNKPEEGEDDVKSACPLHLGRLTCYNGWDKEMLPCEGKLTSKTQS